MNIQKNISLKKYNTFGINAYAKEFVSVTSTSELKEILNQNKSIFILSGGSNLLLTQDLDSLVVHLNLKGISYNYLNENEVLVTAKAGENWHDFVLWCIEHNFGGLENLSLIPGNVGTSPIQNIGAYGVEVKDTIHSVETIAVNSNEEQRFSNKECNFGYRNSNFKNIWKGKYVVTAVTFKLTRRNHNLHTNYGVIANYLKGKDITIQAISNAVIAIRQSKLPDPKKIGNSGSFFKNPIIKEGEFNLIQSQFENIPFYPLENNLYKIPAGWMIEQCGFKGKRIGDAGVHKNQALVLVNYGNAKGSEILALANAIKEAVMKKFQIVLEFEVNII
ncbi:MAG: UDP-N-acetylmuramate dehydrogenase [Lutibacter sp.]